MQPRRWQPKFDFEFGVPKQNLISMSKNLAPDIVRVNDCQIGRIQINQLELACRIHLDFRMTSTELSVSNRVYRPNDCGQLLRVAAAATVRSFRLERLYSSESKLGPSPGTSAASDGAAQSAHPDCRREWYIAHQRC